MPVIIMQVGWQSLFSVWGLMINLDGRVISSISSIAGAGGKMTGQCYYHNQYTAGKAVRMELHTGNGLASMSLLEGLVIGSSVGKVVMGAVDDGNGMTESTRVVMDRAQCLIKHRLMTMMVLLSSSSITSMLSSCPNNAIVAWED